jgi:hypothetical protein
MPFVNFPHYLTDPQAALLAAELDRYESANYYTRMRAEELLQGDGWSGLDVVNVENGDRARIKGITLSNSCDIDRNNRRAMPPSVVFAPLVALQKFKNRLGAAGIGSGQIDDKIAAIKKQQITSVFYLPMGANLSEDYIALLDDLHTVPLHMFRNADQPKLFTLSQVGFYLFITKLSIHFCRFSEGIYRDQ